jgi:hypothetical protein
VSAFLPQATLILDDARSAPHQHHWLRSPIHRANAATRYYCPTCGCWGRAEQGTADETPPTILAYPRPGAGPIPTWVDEDVHCVHFAPRRLVAVDDPGNLTAWTPPYRLMRWS